MTAQRILEAPARPAGAWADLWRPSHWRDLPERPQATTIQLAALGALVLYANVIVNEVLAPAWYVPFNMGILLVALLVARNAGTTWEELGMRRDTVGRGLLLGGAVSLVVVAALALAVVVPWSRSAFEDERIVEGSILLSVYHSLFRVPLGTALYEEVLFRGVIFGMISRRRSALGAAAWSSLLFGIWHVLPALDAIATNPLGEALGGSVVAIVGAVVSTTLVGLAFVWLRLYARSIVAPILVHVTANSVAILAATLAVHVL